ncbi:MAG: hypothetical protein ACPLPS_10345 [bacterium]
MSEARDKALRLLKRAIQTGGNIHLRVVKLTRWQKAKGDDLALLVTGKKTYKDEAYFPAPPSGAEEIARWDTGKFDVNRWG